MLPKFTGVCPGLNQQVFDTSEGAIVIPGHISATKRSALVSTASTVIGRVPSNFEKRAASRSTLLMTSVTTELGEVSLEVKAKNFQANWLLSAKTSFLVLKLYSKVSCLNSSKHFPT